MTKYIKLPIFLLRSYLRGLSQLSASFFLSLFEEQKINVLKQREDSFQNWMMYPLSR